MHESDPSSRPKRSRRVPSWSSSSSSSSRTPAVHILVDASIEESFDIAEKTHSLTVPSSDALQKAPFCLLLLLLLLLLLSMSLLRAIQRALERTSGISLSL
uniref:Uncharacterized protein n=1 Tax=Pseudo-nitzschia australis TaxID=44445 RepID=A0A7S4EM81_9STRA